ncbi:o-succinylbenzoate synthase [Mycetocola spongiae]|uniref:o-succinylbenzoate synthase n=1 Tax=Mycetocola spongiae TaxID=2859226 RepID=UPI001CF5C701|nr:o-succinylbenzoate synthase [Mycetocola spongiae]UCR87983.1 o-succinylbenzoate synthase [Mycetocola spongiae]
MSTPVPLPSLDHLLDSARVVSLPLRTRFRGITTREALLFSGPAGWSEFSPFVEYDTAESSTWLAGALDFAYRPVTGVLRERIPVNATVPAVEAEALEAILALYPGCTTAKIKVAEPGQGLGQEIARVARTRELMGPDARLRVDANGLWSVDQAEEALRALAPYRLEYAEQPCATVPELAELRARLSGLGIPIAADESVRKASDPLAVARAGAADLLVVKAQPLGGITRARALIAETGLPVVVSSALDTSVGLSMGALLAATVPGLDFACGLGTAALLAADVTESPLLPINGSIAAARVEVSPALLDEYRAAPEREAWWFARLAACHGYLAERA